MLVLILVYSWSLFYVAFTSLSTTIEFGVFISDLSFRSQNFRCPLALECFVTFSKYTPHSPQFSVPALV